MGVVGQVVFVSAHDGVRLAGTLYLPLTEGPFATLVEALPYRMDDVTAPYAETYLRYVNEGGFAVVRLDLRGTGSSGGTAVDEYPDIERRDLTALIEWIATQPWSTGRVGLFGTSYSGFNSLHMAAEGLPQLGAVAATYATDDRYSDDVHHMGGVLRALDLVDYPLYMIAMNALPPAPAVWAERDSGRAWLDEWGQRIENTEPWLLEWLRHPLPDATWRRGSVRLGPHGEGYDLITCPVTLVAGWADGYRNNTFRTIEHLVDWRLIAGPWSHSSPSKARPGPNIDIDRELIAFFHHHLRGGPPPSSPRGKVFVRRPTAPEPDLALHVGHWVGIDTWPLEGLHPTVLTVAEPAGEQAGDGEEGRDRIDEVRAVGDVGTMAWNSCAGSLPWGQPLEQSADNARSIVYDWPQLTEMMILGNSEVAMHVRSSAPLGHVSVKLCDIAPDGTSTLITRGMLDLNQRGLWPSDPFGIVDAGPKPVVPDEWIDVRLQFEATTWTMLPGHRLRLAVAGTDWPNCWPPAGPFTLGVKPSSVRLTLFTTTDLPSLDDPFEPGESPDPSDADGVEWLIEHDVLARETRVHTSYGATYPGSRGSYVTDHYEGSLGVSTTDPANAWARGLSRFEIAFLETTCVTEATLHMVSDHHWFHVDITLSASLDGEPFATRHWTERFPR